MANIWILLAYCTFIGVASHVVNASSDPCRITDSGEQSNCRLTNRTVGCPSKKEFIEKRFSVHCCCPCDDGYESREGEPLSVRCHPKPQGESTVIPTSISFLTSVDSADVTPSSPASPVVTSTSTGRSSTTTTRTPAPTTPLPSQTATTQGHGNDDKETTSSGTLGPPFIERYKGPIIGGSIIIFLLLVFAVVWYRKKKNKSHKDGKNPAEKAEMVDLLKQDNGGEKGTPPSESQKSSENGIVHPDTRNGHPAMKGAGSPPV